MLCTIYKSSKKALTYLFVNKREDFSDVPEGLMKTFGKPVLVSVINLAGRDKLAMADITRVKEELSSTGFYLQLPPPNEDLLKDHKAQMMAKKKNDVDGGNK